MARRYKQYKPPSASCFNMEKFEKIIQLTKIALMMGFLVVMGYFIATGGIPCRIVG